MHAIFSEGNFESNQRTNERCRSYVRNILELIRAQYLTQANINRKLSRSRDLFFDQSLELEVRASIRKGLQIQQMALLASLKVEVAGLLSCHRTRSQTQLCQSRLNQREKNLLLDLSQFSHLVESCNHAEHVSEWMRTVEIDASAQDGQLYDAVSFEDITKIDKSCDKVLSTLLFLCCKQISQAHIVMNQLLRQFLQDREHLIELYLYSVNCAANFSFQVLALFFIVLIELQQIEEMTLIADLAVELNNLFVLGNFLEKQGHMAGKLTRLVEEVQGRVCQFFHFLPFYEGKHTQKISPVGRGDGNHILLVFGGLNLWEFPPRVHFLNLQFFQHVVLEEEQPIVFYLYRYLHYKLGPLTYFSPAFKQKIPISVTAQFLQHPPKPIVYFKQMVHIFNSIITIRLHCNHKIYYQLF